MDGAGSPRPDSGYCSGHRLTVVVVHVVTDISNGYNFTNGNSISRYSMGR